MQSWVCKTLSRRAWWSRTAQVGRRQVIRRTVVWEGWLYYWWQLGENGTVLMKTSHVSLHFSLRFIWATNLSTMELLRKNLRPFPDFLNPRYRRRDWISWYDAMTREHYTNSVLGGFVGILSTSTCTETGSQPGSAVMGNRGSSGARVALFCDPWIHH